MYYLRFTKQISEITGMEMNVKSFDDLTASKVIICNERKACSKDRQTYQRFAERQAFFIKLQ